MKHAKQLLIIQKHYLSNLTENETLPLFKRAYVYVLARPARMRRL